ncbi:MAG: hypothetical protein NT157_02730 [Candidatus Micrarchaeota archaeon]|nr:hypothetical protein [Candidatus Micrarchaeota archaeon]
MRMAAAVLVLLLIATPYFAQGECPVFKVPTITELTVSRNEVSGAMEATATLSYEDKARATVRPLPLQDIWFQLCPVSNATVNASLPCPSDQRKCIPGEWNCTGGCCLVNPQIQVVKTNLDGRATALYPLMDAGVIAEYKGGDAYLPSNSTSAYTKSSLGFLNITICMPLFIVLAMLMMSMMAMGRSPISAFDFSAIKAPRAAHKSVTTIGFSAGAIVAAAKGISGAVKGKGKADEKKKNEAQKEVDKAQKEVDKGKKNGKEMSKAEGKLNEAKAAMKDGDYDKAKSCATQANSAAKASNRGTFGKIMHGIGSAGKYAAGVGARAPLNPLGAVRDLAALPAKTFAGLAAGGVSKARGKDFKEGYKQGSGAVGKAIKDPLGAVAGAAKFQAKTMVGLVTGVKGALTSGSAKKGYAKGKEGAKSAEKAIEKGGKALAKIGTLGGATKDDAKKEIKKAEASIEKAKKDGAGEEKLNGMNKKLEEANAAFKEGRYESARHSANEVVTGIARGTGGAAFDEIRGAVSPVNLLKELIGGSGYVGSKVGRAHDIGGVKLAFGSRAIRAMMSELSGMYEKKKRDELVGKIEEYQKLSGEQKIDKEKLGELGGLKGKDGLRRIEEAEGLREMQKLGVELNEAQLGKLSNSKESLATMDAINKRETRLGALASELDGKSVPISNVELKGCFAFGVSNKIRIDNGELWLEPETRVGPLGIPASFLRAIEYLNILAVIPQGLYVMKFEFGKLGMNGSTTTGIAVNADSATPGSWVSAIDNELEGQKAIRKEKENLGERQKMVEKEAGEFCEKLPGFRKIYGEISAELERIGQTKDPVKRLEMLRDFDRKSMGRLRTLTEELSGNMDDIIDERYDIEVKDVQLDLRKSSLGLIALPEKIVERAKGQKPVGNERQNADAMKLLDRLEKEESWLEKEVRDKNVGEQERQTLQERLSDVREEKKAIFTFHPLGGETADLLGEIVGKHGELRKAYENMDVERINGIEGERMGLVRRLAGYSTEGMGRAEEAGQSLSEVYSAYSLGYMASLAETMRGEVQGGIQMGTLNESEISEREKAIGSVEGIQDSLISKAAAFKEVKKFDELREMRILPKEEFEKMKIEMREKSGVGLLPDEVRERLAEFEEKQAAEKEESGRARRESMGGMALRKRDDEREVKREQTEERLDRIAEEMTSPDRLMDLCERIESRNLSERQANELKLQAELAAEKMMGSDASEEEKMKVREAIRRGKNIVEEIAMNRTIREKINNEANMQFGEYRKVFGTEDVDMKVDKKAGRKDQDFA